MRRMIKGVGILLAVLLGILVLIIAVVYYVTQKRIDRVYSAQVVIVPVPISQEAIDRGKHLVTTTGFCTDCHGNDFSGMVFDDGPLVGRLVAVNLTAGKGGIGTTFTNADWVRAIRHGIGQDKKSLISMPSNYYYNYTDADLGAIIAYLKSLPPVDNETPKTNVGPLGRIFLFQDPTLLPAEVIDHTGPRPPVPAPGVNQDYGKYLATFCTICHGNNFGGGTSEIGGANLTPGGDLASWSYQDFITTLRTGIKPNGDRMDPKIMPWKAVGQMTDDELKAIWVYLESLPPVEDIPAPIPTKVR